MTDTPSAAGQRRRMFRAGPFDLASHILPRNHATTGAPNSTWFCPASQLDGPAVVRPGWTAGAVDNGEPFHGHRLDFEIKILAVQRLGRESETVAFTAALQRNLFHSFPWVLPNVSIMHSRAGKSWRRQSNMLAALPFALLRTSADSATFQSVPTTWPLHQPSSDLVAQD